MGWTEQPRCRGVNVGWAEWAIAYLGFGRTEDAIGQQQCTALLHLPTQFQIIIYAPVLCYAHSYDAEEKWLVSFGQCTIFSNKTLISRL